MPLPSSYKHRVSPPYRNLQSSKISQTYGFPIHPFIQHVKTLAAKELLANQTSSASASAETSSDENDERVRGAAAPGGLADLARSLGFVTEQKPSIDAAKPAAAAEDEEEETKADAVVVSAGTAQDEEGVVWDGV